MTLTKDELLEKLFDLLTKHGKNPRRYEKTERGVVDIVTDDAAYEVVAIASPDVILSAVPRILTRRDALNPKLQAFICSGHPGTEPTKAINDAKRWGVTVHLWKESDKPG